MVALENIRCLPTEDLCAIVWSTNPNGAYAKHRERAVNELRAHRFHQWFYGAVAEFPRECVPDNFMNHPRVR